MHLLYEFSYYQYQRNKNLKYLWQQQEALCRSEERFKNIVETSTEFIWEVDSSDIFTYASPYVFELLDYHPHEVEGTSLYALIPDQQQTLFKQTLQTYWENQQAYYKIEKCYRHKDGRLLTVSSSARPFFNQEGEFLGYRGTDHDITLEKEAQRIQREKEYAESASKAKSSFLAKMSHELRTPMHSIISFSSMGISKIEQADRSRNLRYFNNILTSANRLMRLIDNLLDLAKLESGKIQMNYSQVSLLEICKNCIEPFQSQLEEHKLTINLLTESVNAAVDCDEEKIYQVMTNYIANAIKFSKAGQAIVIAVLPATLFSESDDDIDAIKFMVRDQGPGIKENELQTIFDEFQQSAQLTTNTYKGTGLGLPICREIIALHGGKAWAENHPEGGAVFYFIIPREQ